METASSFARRRAFVWATLLLVLLLAAALRFYQFGTLPPGLNHDEAAHEIAARELLQTRRWAPFFPINYGLEAGYISLIAGLFALTGPFAEGGRFVSSLVGLLSVPLAFALAREMLRRVRPGRSATVGALVAAAQTACTYWYVYHSRIGFEVILVPATSMLAFWALWRAARDESLWRYALAGALLGLCLYTYPAARLVPLVPAIQGVVLIMFWRRAAIRRWPCGLVYVGAAVVVAAPLLIFFAQNPDILLMRARQVAVLSPGALWDSVLKTFGGLVWRGDSNPRLNLPGRPLLDPLQSVLLVTGTVVLLRRLRQPVSLFILLWTGMMLMPGLLSDYPPHFARLCGVLPPLVLLITLGGMTLTDGLHKLNRALAWGVMPAALLITGIWTAHDYFVSWPRVPDLLSTFDAGFRRTAEIIRDLPSGVPVYLSPIDREYLTIRFVVGEARMQQIRSYNGRTCSVLPRGLAYQVIIVAEDQRSLPILKQVFPQGQVTRRENLGPNPYLAVFETSAGMEPQLRLAHERKDTFGGVIRLRGFNLEERGYHPGETLQLEIAWQAATAAQRDYTSFVQLVGSPNPQTGNSLWGQQDAQPCDNSYPTTRWSPGEWIVEERSLTIAPDSPAGDYSLSVGWYDLGTGERLPVDSGGDHVILTTLRVAPR
jgi:hypothetical protein